MTIPTGRQAQAGERRQPDPPHSLVLGITPCETPSASLAAAVTNAGGLGVLDLGDGGRNARDALVSAMAMAQGRSLGIRVPAGCALTCDVAVDLLGADVERVETVVLAEDAPWQISDVPDRHLVLVEVTSWQEALVAAERGADGIIARGNEAGGRASEFGSFVLLQRLLAEPKLRVPVWVCGGIGPRTAAAAVAGGAAGVVLDTQLALLPESELSDGAKATIAASDGTNSVVVAGRRMLTGRTGAAQDRLPAGQDAFLANRFAARYGTAARSVRAVLSAINDTALADTASILGEGSALATAWGTRHPVAQGPMTRVSDQAGFAAAVAAEGGLPFVALALSDERKTEELLAQTRESLGDRPWGVGVLGFAPEDIRTAQLDVIRRLRPSTALIAGGRPDQARTLEEQGIATFLHVPSPGLLEQYLEAGARKFVFEGSECGGHVGPRSSFPLWEAQLGVLLDFADAGGDVEQLQVLFAGGIHDALSAAMVAALAAPLAGEGAAVGVLMGTGYLFTEEAVAHGAVGPVFQQQVLAAQRTDLLETAPGHATRCVQSPFVETFRSAVRELEQDGTDRREIWERLEQLNVGRLRIASKGIRREGDELVPVEETQQRELGLFMAGQVAALRSEVTTIAALHADVTAGAAAMLGDATRDLRHRLGIVEETGPRQDPLDIAIVGMSSIFPGATDVAEFWSNILGNVDAVTEVPADRWDSGLYYADPAEKADPPRGDWTPSKWGGFLPEVPFDPLKYGIPPSALGVIDAVQLLALQVSEQALADAGYAGGGRDRSRTGVVFATAQGSDLKNANTVRMVLPSYLGTLPGGVGDQLPRVTEDTLPGQLGSIVAGRVANRLDLGGANFTIDAACASSLAAVDAACKELANGNSDMMLCGGADLHNSVEDFLLFGAVGALSPTGRCKTFDSSADGIALSEGVACVVLKRLADAERDGDRIYGVIKGVGSGSDGKALGLTAPRPDGQRRALERAYRSAGVSPAQVGLVEAHGTGTVVGDRTELQTLTSLFGDAGAEPGSCALGSVKSQIGHTKCAAGLAGLIKVTLAVYDGVKPPTNGIAEPNPAWQPCTSPFVFHSEPVPWAAAAADRVAGVSAFGFGGTNFHVVVSGHHSASSRRHGTQRWPAELFLFSGADQDSAHRGIERLLTLTETNAAQGTPWSLADLAKTAAVRCGNDSNPVRVAVVATDLDELPGLLRAAAEGENDPRRGIFRAPETEDHGKLAVLFPGQGSQRPGMLAELFVAFPELQRILAAAAEPAGEFGSPDAVLDAMFPPAAFGQDEAREQRERLTDTTMAQPALGLTGMAVHHLLARLGVEADMYAGHSYGELVALAAAGSLRADSLLTLSQARADAILAAAGDDPGTMAAVAAGAEDVERVLAEAGLADQVVVANHNAPRQVVISGATAQVEAAVERLRACDIAAKRVPVACAFHSPMVEGAAARFAQTLAGYRIEAPDRPVWTNRTGGTYPADGQQIAVELAAQIISPVRFRDQIEAMYADGARTFFEAGPGTVLSGLVGKILGDRPHTVISCESGGRQGVHGLLTAVGQLAVSGADVQPGWLFAGRDARDVSTLTPPAQPGWTVDGALVRTKAGQALPGGLTPATQIEIEDITVNPSQPTNGRSDADALVSEFLRSNREMINAQRDVLLSYFGSPGALPPAPAAPTQPVVSAELVAAAAESPSVVADAQPEPEVAPASPASTQDVESLVIEVIAQRTGYPVDMISADLDLEADLSIDSIKRTEIAGELVSTLGLEQPDTVEALTKARTAAAMADTLGAGADPKPAQSRPEAALAQEPGGALVEAPRRYVLQLHDAPGEEAEPTALVGANVLIAGGEQEQAELVAAEVSARGGMPFVIGPATEIDPEIAQVDVFVSLHALEHNGEPVLPGAYPVLRSALSRTPKFVLAGAPGGDVVAQRAAGLRGFVRAAGLEYPDTTVRLVELDQAADNDAVAADVLAELLTHGEEPVVVRAGGRRQAFSMMPSSLGTLAETGSGPGGTGSAEVAAMGLDADSVVLLVGGARGITAQVALALARTSGCRVELAGRTVLATEPEPEAVAAAQDLPSLRGALAQQGGIEPAAIERAARDILAQREVAATLAELRASGAEAEYHTVDARDPESMRRLLKEVHADRGRLDGIVYAAGIVDDKLVADKDPDSFAKVYGTKVDGAAALLGELGQLPSRPRFVVFFGSIVAVQGNRGQSDYAAANDALDSLGALSVAESGGRVITVHWGPWAPAEGHGGMISAELSRTYADRGIALIDPAESVECLLRELAWGKAGASSVIYTASGW